MINDKLAAFIKHKKELIDKTDRQIMRDCDIDKRSFYAFLRRELLNGKPRGVKLSTADNLLRAVNSDWLEFSQWQGSGDE